MNQEDILTMLQRLEYRRKHDPTFDWRDQADLDYLRARAVEEAGRQLRQAIDETFRLTQFANWLEDKRAALADHLRRRYKP